MFSISKADNRSLNSQNKNQKKNLHSHVEWNPVCLSPSWPCTPTVHLTQCTPVTWASKLFPALGLELALLYLWDILPQDQRSMNFIVKGQIVIIFTFVNQVVCFTTTQLCHCSGKQPEAIPKQVSVALLLCSNTILCTEQVMSQIWSTGHRNLLTPALNLPTSGLFWSFWSHIE